MDDVSSKLDEVIKRLDKIENQLSLGVGNSSGGWEIAAYILLFLAIPALLAAGAFLYWVFKEEKNASKLIIGVDGESK